MKLKIHRAATPFPQDLTLTYNDRLLEHEVARTRCGRLVEGDRLRLRARGVTCKVCQND